MTIDFAARSEIGRRETNDDRVLAGSRILNGGSMAGRLTLPGMAVVCDGCGGYDGGGIAAETVLRVLAGKEPSALQDRETIERVLEDCEKEVAKQKEVMPEYPEMCTTIAGCIFTDTKILIFHAGDSRVYRCDEWGLARMTLDHSAVQTLINMGRIAEKEALTHPNRNLITRCIGGDTLPPELYVAETAIGPGEKFLLCSDGLSDFVPDSRMKEILSADLPLDAMADILVETAFMQGSDDNISVCICAAEDGKCAAESKPLILD